MTNLIFQILTWNVGSTDPPNEHQLSELVNVNKHQSVDIYAVYFQEIETGIVETAKSFVSYDDWTKSFIQLLTKSEYYLVANVRVQGITLSVFALLKHLPFIRHVKTDIERTGALASTWGNKGGVAISASVYNHSLCFLNTHLAAHLTDDSKRIDDFKEVLEEIDFSGTTTIFDHEIVFWAGDVNFRLEEISREEVIKVALNESSFDQLLKYDQLKRHMEHKCIFTEFQEGPILFPPTYKFDPGSDNYDTSEKQRKPAYTDRILHRVNPDKSFVHDLVKMELSSSSKEQSSYASNLVQQVQGTYKSLPQFKQSDHKPVTAQYSVSITDKLSPLVKLSVDANKSDDFCDVTVTYCHGMVSDSKDYLALYEEKFENAQSYKTWKSLGETSETLVTESFNKICKFSTDKREKAKLFRIGYYSDRMSCLLALTEPFLINC